MPELELLCTGMPAAWAAEAQDRLVRAASALDLGARFGAVEICADDLAGSESAWLHFGASAQGGAPALTVFCPVEAFASRRTSGGGLFPAREIWEQSPTPADADVFEFDVDETDRFLHHELLLAADLFDRKLDRDAVPDPLIESLMAAWSVTLDGRLRRRGLPGYDLAYRRGRFSRLFSGAGVLLPGHWEIFQALWDGALDDFQGILSACRQLPRL